MRLSDPFGVVTPTMDGPVLAVLSRHGAPMATSAVHSALGDFSLEGVRRTLKRLACQGIVRAQRESRGWTYVLNTDHVAAPAVHMLANLAETLAFRIERIISGWERPPEFVALIDLPPWARSRASTGLLLVRDEELDPERRRPEVESLSSLLRMWTGRRVAMLDMATADLHASANAGLAEWASTTGTVVRGDISTLPLPGVAR